MNRKDFLVVLLVVALGGLSGGRGFADDKNEMLENIARYLKRQAKACLYEVKEVRVKYEDSVQCKRLSAEAFQYARLGGWELDSEGNIKDSFTKHGLYAEQARTLAWRARAISAAGDPSLSIW